MSEHDGGIPRDLGNAYDAIPVPVTVFRPTGEYVYVNPNAVEVLRDVAAQVSADKLIGRRWQELFPAQMETSFGRTFAKVVADPGGARERVPVPGYSSRAGSRWKAHMWRDSEGLVHVISLREGGEDGGRDVAQAGLRRVIEGFPFGACVVFDRDLRYISASGRGLEEAGLDPTDLVGRTIWDLWPEEVSRILEGPYRRAFEGHESDFLVTWRGRVYRSWVSSISDERGEPIAGVLLTLDVTEEAELEQQLRRIHASLDALGLGVTIAEAGGDQPLIYVSRGFTQLTGYEEEEVLGRNCRFLQGPETDPAAVERIRTAVRAGEPIQQTLLNYRKDGSTFWNRMTISPLTTASGEPTHLIGFQEDVTRQREAGRELERSRRLNALGRLAGGLAHDMRNVLTGASLVLDLHASRDDLPPDLLEDLAEARKVLRQGASVTDRLLAFARDESSATEVVDLVEFVRDRRRLLRTLLRESIDIRLDLDDGPVRIEADESRLDQALLNLATNAEEAMPDGGVLTLGVRPEVPGEMLRRHAPGGADPGGGRWVALVVSDVGEGMTPEVAARAFEPFFTTRSETGGTGLGLASVHGVVQSMGGLSWIESEPGHGTDVTLAFPVADASSAEGSLADAGVAGDGVAGVRVLLVEDDRAIRRVCRRYLTREGAEVVTAADGADAARRFDDGPEDFDVVVTDAIMPTMSGPDLLSHVRRRVPDLPAVLVSGYHEFELSDDLAGLVRLSKPFSMTQLVEAIRRALAQRAPGDAAPPS